MLLVSIAFRYQLYRNCKKIKTEKYANYTQSPLMFSFSRGFEEKMSLSWEAVKKRNDTVFQVLLDMLDTWLNELQTKLQ
jgi:hypothetical protein